jgi:uncharacterized protein
VIESDLVFLDSNVLFSAALGGDTFARYLRLADEGAIRLVSTRACVAEAVTNLERKRPGSIGGLAEVVARVRLVDPNTSARVDEAAELVGGNDAHVLAAAWVLGATALVTGDVKDFGKLMSRDDVSLRVRTPRSFLIEITAGPLARER